LEKYEIFHFKYLSIGKYNISLKFDKRKLKLKSLKKTWNVLDFYKNFLEISPTGVVEKCHNFSNLSFLKIKLIINWIEN
jgi:hypothetical protein